MASREEIAEAAAKRTADRAANARAHLAAGDTRQALWVGLNGIATEATKLRGRSNGDGMLTDAELTGMLLGIAAGLHAHDPGRPAGCPSLPRPADLIAMLDTALARNQGGAG